MPGVRLALVDKVPVFTELIVQWEKQMKCVQNMVSPCFQRNECRKEIQDHGME